MAFDVEAAKAAGYSQEEIDAYLQGQPKTKVLAPVAPGQEADVSEPPPPTTTVTPAGEGNYMPTLATAGLVTAGAAVPAALGYGVAKYGGRMMDAARNLIQGGGVSASSIPTTNPAAINVGAGPAAVQTAGPSAVAQEAQQIQKANSIVRNLALSKLLGPAALAAGGAAATGMAAGQMRAMSPEQRRGFYENPMLGAMGGDAALGAAIMNQGQ